MLKKFEYLMPRSNDFDMSRDMQDCQWFKDKVRASESYAQNLYAAMCNTQWQRAEIWPVLRDEYWSCSWRSAGGIVADLRACGEDYMNYYCSGMGGFAALDDETEEEAQAHFKAKGFVPEEEITDEIRNDLAQLGWQPVTIPRT
jgi:hypothetical protein